MYDKKRSIGFISLTWLDKPTNIQGFHYQARWHSLNINTVSMLSDVIKPNPGSTTCKTNLYTRTSNIYSDKEALVHYIYGHWISGRTCYINYKLLDSIIKSTMVQLGLMFNCYLILILLTKFDTFCSVFPQIPSFRVTPFLN